MLWDSYAFFSCFWILFHESTSVAVIDYVSYLFRFTRRFCEVTRPEPEVSLLCRSEENLNHVLKTNNRKIFKVLLTNKIFSNEDLSWGFKMELCLNRGLSSNFLCLETNDCSSDCPFNSVKMNWARALWDWLFVSNLLLSKIDFVLSSPKCRLDDNPNRINFHLVTFKNLSVDVSQFQFHFSVVGT